jgi:hypothetical protein
MKLLITSSSSWFLSLRASSSVIGDRRFFFGYIGGGNYCCMIGGLDLAGGYMMRFIVEFPLAIFMFPMQHPMYASAVVSHGLPNINGGSSSLLIGLITRKPTGYPKSRLKLLHLVMCRLV